MLPFLSYFFPVCKKEAHRHPRHASFLPLYSFSMCAAADFSIRRLVPTWSKAISNRASPPIFWTDRTIPCPNALCRTVSPFWKAGRLPPPPGAPAPTGEEARGCLVRALPAAPTWPGQSLHRRVGAVGLDPSGSRPVQPGRSGRLRKSGADRSRNPHSRRSGWAYRSSPPLPRPDRTGSSCPAAPGAPGGSLPQSGRDGWSWSVQRASADWRR